MQNSSPEVLPAEHAVWMPSEVPSKGGDKLIWVPSVIGFFRHAFQLMQDVFHQQYELDVANSLYMMVIATGIDRVRQI